MDVEYNLYKNLAFFIDRCVQRGRLAPRATLIVIASPTELDTRPRATCLAGQVAPDIGRAPSCLLCAKFLTLLLNAYTCLHYCR